MEEANSYDQDDLSNGIGYAEGLLEMGFSEEPHDEYNLRGYIKWAKAKLNKEDEA